MYQKPCPAPKLDPEATTDIGIAVPDRVVIGIMPSLRDRVLREPLVHFAVLAVLVFGVHRLFGEPEATPAPASATRPHIVIDEAFVDGLVEQDRIASGRAPDREEVTNRWLRDEILAREATRLGLAEHDPIMRQRLVQLAELWLEANVQVADPTDEQLQFILERDRARYVSPATVAFVQVFFASSRARADEDAADARAQITGMNPMDAARLGDPHLLGVRIAASTQAELAGSFGAPFAAAVFSLDERTWSEPIQSSFGFHLVYISEREDARIPTLDAVRARVRSDWLAERTRTEVRRARAELRAAYVIERR